jgi:hypothetical protein
MKEQSEDVASAQAPREAPTMAIVPAAGASSRSSIGPGLLAGFCAALIALVAAVVVIVVNATEMRQVQRQQSEAARIALSLSVNQLHAVALRNVPFGAELGLVRAIAGGDPAMVRDLAILEPLQNEGLPGIKRIVGDFEQIAAGVLIAERTGPRPGWLGQVVGRMSAVTVALAMELNWNPLSSETAPPIRAIAEALSRGDLAKAVRGVEALPAAARSEFEPWRELVQRRLDAIAAIDRLMSRTATDQRSLRSAQSL